jgi:hypothetical protein
MPNIRFLTDEESREILQKAIIELSSQVDTLKSQAEFSRLQMETLLTQNAELSSQIQELKVKNLETSTKFEKFVNALWERTKPYLKEGTYIGAQFNHSKRIYDMMHGVIKTIDMDK